MVLLPVKNMAKYRKSAREKKNARENFREFTPVKRKIVHVKKTDNYTREKPKSARENIRLIKSLAVGL